MKNKFYCQCILHKDNWAMVSYIPSPLAVKGKVIDIRDPDSKKWKRGWTVQSVGPKVDGELVESNSQSWKHHRSTTDI